MNMLGLTWKVEAKTLDDTLASFGSVCSSSCACGGATDLVNIADVGFGVSQTLPVLVALLTAQPGQLVYIEQPEIHLHPSAQAAMASLLVKAANRGVAWSRRRIALSCFWECNPRWRKSISSPRRSSCTVHSR